MDLSKRQWRVLKQAYDAIAPSSTLKERSFCTSWAARGLGISTKQVYAALRSLDRRALVERAGKNNSLWRITDSGIASLAIKKMA